MSQSTTHAPSAAAVARWKIVALLCACAMSSSWAAPAQACTNDIDCTEGGTACGTMVCSYDITPPACVAAGQHPAGSDGWCTVNADCKCQSLGATCAAPYCTFTTPPADAGRASPGVDAGETSASDEDASTGLHSSSGCSLASATSRTTLFAPAGLLVAAGLASSRMRRRPRSS